MIDVGAGRAGVPRRGKTSVGSPQTFVAAKQRPPGSSGPLETGVMGWNTNCMSWAGFAGFWAFLEYELPANPHGCSRDPRPVTPGVAGSSPVHSAKY